MNFDLTEEQRLLVDTVASFARKQSPLTRMRALRADPRGWSPELWKQMGDLGLLGISMPEAVGGAGGTFADAALILEQLAATLVPEPFLACLVAAAPILRLGTEDDRLPPQSALGELGAETPKQLTRDHIGVADLPGPYVRGGDRTGIGYFCFAHENSHDRSCHCPSAMSRPEAISAVALLRIEHMFVYCELWPRMLLPGCRHRLVPDR